MLMRKEIVIGYRFSLRFENSKRIIAVDKLFGII